MFPFGINSIGEVQHWQHCWLVFFGSSLLLYLLVKNYVGTLYFPEAKAVYICAATGLFPGIAFAATYCILVGAQHFGAEATIINSLFPFCFYLLLILAVSVPLIILVGTITAIVERSARLLFVSIFWAVCAGILCYWVNDVLIYHFKAGGKTFAKSPSGYSSWIKER